MPAFGGRAFLSSGTWSLLGIEVPRPIITPRALEANFTNEGGVCGTTRLLKNIGGLWLLQACRRGWARDGRNYDYAELMDAAGDDRHAFLSLFDPDDPVVPASARHGAARSPSYCRRTGQPEPAGPASFTRAILESLAFKYRVVLDTLEELTGMPIAEVQIVGGGSRNRLLNQFTADATGRTRAGRAGRGDRARQHRHADAGDRRGRQRWPRRAASSNTRSPSIGSSRTAADRWSAHYRRFQDYVELTCV